MNLGVTVALFSVIATVLMGLFCLLLRCFHYYRHAQLKQAAHRYSDQNGISHPLSSWEGQYQQFCQKRAKQKLDLKDTLLEEDVLIEMSELRKVFNVSNNIYSNKANLVDRLNNPEQPWFSQMDRADTPKLDIKLQKLHNEQSFSEKHVEQENVFKFTRRLIRYNREGFFLVQITPLNIKKEGGHFVLKKKTEQSTIQKQFQNFQDILQSYGFAQHCYGFSRVVCQVETRKIKEGKVFAFDSLQMREFKEDIDNDKFTQILGALQEEKVESS